MRPQPVAKENALQVHPVAGAAEIEADAVGVAACERPPAVAIGIAVKVVGAGLPDELDRLRNETFVAQHGVHVDLRLGREAGNRGAADVVDTVHAPTEKRQKCVAFGGELFGPRWIIVDNHDGSHAGQTA